MFAAGAWCRRGGIWKWSRLAVVAEKFGRERSCALAANLLRAVGAVTGAVLAAAGILDSDALAAAAGGLPLIIVITGGVYYLAARD